MAAVRRRMIGVLSKLSTYSSTYVGFSTLARRREAVYNVCHKCTVLAVTCSSVRPEVGGKRHLLSNNGGGLSLVNKAQMSQDAWSLPPKQGLYDPQNEKDACGVGFIVSIDGTRSHKVSSHGI
ncbi:uncharacterized protein LOC124357098 [Homalodisca vitripennis]|uniref:uncharacterized protein LOC124357098 n=1 Tax=Homalodisca vitripennis TaxID=197043 RepID=UPI001EEA657A|nr:uncharacterized protein LOC124357098 [Homalodisca vitripennis]XP_046664491.1 uncharacterized protein LOC124357098 [Homalodisca vitripennis]XP_046664492.1 uncharacterized protein LOC124357098 [Homalodisca vitripennis]XP_046664494.1 uncharacterized protein LOC124357098 [Homalodisca vitripennis]XP_046664495.1 uncharacterized protein LOC124357098 [Homalodisca vitripennis]